MKTTITNLLFLQISAAAMAFLTLLPRCTGFSPVSSSALSASATSIPSTLPTNEDVRVVSAMPDPLPNPLRHSYYLLRHGQSTANVAGIISSDRSLAYSERHGLTDLGREQGQGAAEALVKSLEQEDDVLKSGDQVVFVSSPFARAKQTAEACLEELKSNDALQERFNKLGLELATPDAADIILKENLMERYFGQLDDKELFTYGYVWPVDKDNVTHTTYGVESVAAVCTRLRELIVDDLEQQWPDQKCHIVMSSHADVLQIAQLYGATVDNVGTFSSFRFGNGEVRAMKRTPDSLPDPVHLEAPDSLPDPATLEA